MVETLDSGGSGGGGYREKYRRALDEQEKMEKIYSAQITLIRKTLLQVSTAASGLDGQLDIALNGMRDKFKRSTGEELVSQLDIVNLAVDQFEGNRRAVNSRTVKNTESIIENLLELSLPTDLKKSLKGFSKSLKSRLHTYQVYPEIIDELGKLQMLALDSASNPEKGLWDRIAGGKTVNKVSESSVETDDTYSDIEEIEKSQNIIGLNDPNELAEAASIEQDQKTENIVSSDNTRQETSAIDSESSQEVPLTDEGVATSKEKEDEVKEWMGSSSLDLNESEEQTPVQMGNQANVTFDAGTEDSYERVALRIATTLDGLVKKIEPNDLVRHKIDIVKHRIKRGMDWYVLAVTLEDIRDILLLRYLQNDREFSDYLQRVNEELHSIGEALGLVADQEQSLNHSANQFSQSVSEHMGRMRETLDKGQDVNVLKEEVNQQIASIQDALTDFKDAQAENEQLSKQLEALVSRVKTVEQESQKTKELLEEEHYRATHDSLTGLANREAYNERVFHEFQRFQRYGHPLTLAILDIDHFKNINDTYGHQAGDKVIQLIAKLLSSRVRTVDFVARIGGEEFVVLLPETSADRALIVLDKIRGYLGKIPFRFKDSPVNISLSVGISDFVEGDNVEDVFDRADKALYQAKNDGRNQCVIYNDDSSESPESGDESENV